MRRGFVSVLLAIGLMFLLNGLAWARCPDAECALDNPAAILAGSFVGIAGSDVALAIPTGPAISLTYAQIVNGGATVYAQPAAAPAINWLAPGFVFVSLANTSPVEVGNQKWYQLYQGGYVSASHILVYPPAKFQGVQLAQPPDKSFAWVTADTPVSSAAGAPPAASAPTLTHYTRVTILEQQVVSGTTWYRVGTGEWISQYRVGVVSVSQRPTDIGPTDKWIEVNLFEQTLAAYEGDRMVYATLVSSGLPQWPTTPGLFRIYDKQKQGKMSGDDGQPDYYYL